MEEEIPTWSKSRIWSGMMEIILQNAFQGLDEKVIVSISYQVSAGSHLKYYNEAKIFTHAFINKKILPFPHARQCSFPFLSC